MSSVAEKRFLALEKKIQEEIPGFRIDYKDTTKDWKLRVVGKIVGLFNKAFMTRFTTTLFPVVYFASRDSVESDFGAYFYTLCHEWVHLYDRKTKGFWFTLSYLFPQMFSLLAVFSFLAFWNVWFILCLFFLLFLLPLPSIWRANWEMRGYSMNMAVRVWDKRPIQEDYLDTVVENFTGYNYYRMSLSGKKVKENLLKAQRIATQGFGKETNGNHPYVVVKKIMEEIS